MLGKHLGGRFEFSVKIMVVLLITVFAGSKHTYIVYGEQQQLPKLNFRIRCAPRSVRVLPFSPWSESSCILAPFVVAFGSVYHKVLQK